MDKLSKDWRTRSDIVSEDSTAMTDEKCDVKYRWNNCSGNIFRYQCYTTIDNSKFFDSDTESKVEDNKDSDKLRKLMRSCTRSRDNRRIAVSAEDACLVVEFGRAVTCTCSKENWVARKGKESIFSAFTVTLKQVYTLMPNTIIVGFHIQYN